MDWTDDLRKQVIKEYEEAEPTPENSMEIVKEISDGLDGSTPNGVRAILSKAEVYIKKDQSASKTTDSKTPRVNKTEALKNLKDLLETQEIEIDLAIVDKLTGKAAKYFFEALSTLLED